MSVIKNNPLLKGIRGRLGEMVSRLFRGKVVLACSARKTKTSTNRRRASKSRFLDAVQYANKQVANPVNKAEYAARITGSKVSAYAVAMADFFHAPVVSLIDTSAYRGNVGDTIAIAASDDFKVRSVLVAITDGKGRTIEQGEAMPSEGMPDSWRYTARIANTSLPGTKIAVAASDKPGNIATAEKVL